MGRLAERKDGMRRIFRIESEVEIANTHDICDGQFEIKGSSMFHANSRPCVTATHDECPPEHATEAEAQERSRKVVDRDVTMQANSSITRRKDRPSGWVVRQNTRQQVSRNSEPPPWGTRQFSTFPASMGLD